MGDLMKYLLLGLAAATAMATGANAATLFNYDMASANAYDAVNLVSSFVGASAAPVPEPSTWAMMLVGVGGLGAALRFARKSVGQAALA